MAHLGSIANGAPLKSVKRTIELVDVAIADHLGDRLERDWKTGDKVSQGQIIARRSSGEVLAAPRDGYVIFQDKNPVVGTELFYFGIDSTRLRSSTTLDPF